MDDRAGAEKGYASPARPGATEYVMGPAHHYCGTRGGGRVKRSACFDTR